MKVLRKKGSNIPIKITIILSLKGNEASSEYFLDKEKKDFQSIREFLFKAKNAYISQLDISYKEKLNLRFLHGKQFIAPLEHIERNLIIDSLLRFILNITNNEIPIKEGYKAIIEKKKDFNKASLDTISNYITDLFQQNGITLEEHYNKMKITSKNLKGIYLLECDNNSMDELIINLFLDNLGKLPISQNLLFANEETSSEEIQTFYHRSILCNYNNLFVVKINESFSKYQQNIMNAYIDNLLSYKNDIYNQTSENENFDKKSPNEYLDSYIIFIYDNKNRNATEFLREIKK